MVPKVSSHGPPRSRLRIWSSKRVPGWGRVVRRRRRSPTSLDLKAHELRTQVVHPYLPCTRWRYRRVNGIETPVLKEDVDVLVHSNAEIQPDKRGQSFDSVKGAGRAGPRWLYPGLLLCQVRAESVPRFSGARGPWSGGQIPHAAGWAANSRFLLGVPEAGAVCPCGPPAACCLRPLPGRPASSSPTGTCPRCSSWQWFSRQKQPSLCLPLGRSRKLFKPGRSLVSGGPLGPDSRSGLRALSISLGSGTNPPASRFPHPLPLRAARSVTNVHGG